MIHNPRRKLAQCILGLLISISPTYAQQIFGTIYGTVTDAGGGTIPNAKVIISDEGKGSIVEVQTNESGNYRRERLLPGSYTVTVEQAGFMKSVLKQVAVNVDAAARVDIVMQVGQVSQEIEVSSAAPTLQTDRADVATVFSSKQLVDLPRFDRNFQSFLLLTPGTSQVGWNHASSENPQGSVQIQVGGQHFSATGYQLDGTDNQDPILGIIVINPTLDSVGEAKVSAQNYDAEFGYVGAGLVNASTKSGTNAIHGSAFEYLRVNTPGFQSFARNPFNGAESAANGGVPPVKWNQFGGSIGGSAIKNKLFFFGDAQITRRRTGSSVKTSLPTAGARNGDLSAYVVAGRNNVYDPLTGDQATGLGRQAFPGNRIPVSRISRQSAALVSQLPLPNFNDPSVEPGLRGLVSNYVATGSEVFDSNQWNTRWDYFINEKSTLFGRYSNTTFTRASPGTFGALLGGPALDNINFAGNSDVANRSLSVGYTRVFSPSLVGDFRFGYLRYRVNVTPNGLGTSPAKDIGIPGLNNDPYFTSGLPAFQVRGDGGFNLGYSLGVNQCNCPLAQREQQYQFVGNLTKTVGNHSIKFGADVRRALNLRVPSDAHRSGELTFDGNRVGRVDTNGNVQQGLGIGTFLLGDVTGFQRYVSSSTDASESQKRLYFYVQDTWRINKKLQLNYGLRWELVFPEKVNAAGNGGQLDLSTGNIAVFGVGKVGLDGIQAANYRNFAPRVGVTYQLTPKTVIRAGYGWSYSVGTFGSVFGHNVTQNLPVLANQQLNSPTNFGSVFTLAQGPPSPTFPTPNADGFFRLPDGIAAKARPRNVKLPTVVNYNLTVQHQLSSDLSVQVAYVGNVGRNVFAGDGPNFNVNEPAFVPGVADTNLRRPFFSRYGWTQGIDLYCNCATNNYNSMQIQVTKGSKFGYTVTSSYTYQQAKGDSGDSFTFLYNRPLGRGDRDFIANNQLTISQNFEIPVGKGKRFFGNINRALDTAIGGWQVNGITQYYSGRPFTPNIGDFPSSAVRPNAGPSGRPDIGSKDPYEGALGGRDQFFVGGLGGAFLIPANSTFGNFTLNSLRGPQFINQDLSVSKAFLVRERYRFTIRAEAFNVLNHTNLGQPEANVTSSQAGRINSLGTGAQMRRFQFAARMDF